MNVIAVRSVKRPKVLSRSMVMCAVLLATGCTKATTAHGPAAHAPPTARVSFEGNLQVSSADLAAVVAIDKPGAVTDDVIEEGKRDRAVEQVIGEARGESPSLERGPGDALLGPHARDVLSRDVMQLYALYFDRGYVSVDIGDPQVHASADGRFVDVGILVKEGPRYRLGDVKIEERSGDQPVQPNQPIPSAVAQLMTSKRGDWFSRHVLLREIEAVRTVYRDAGYASVEVNPETTLDPERSTVDILVAVDRQPQP